MDRRQSRWTAWRLVGLIAFGLLTGGAGPAGAQMAEEYAVKASFISKFMAFVQWPQTAAPSQSPQAPDTAGRSQGAPPAPFIISIFGSDPFKDDLLRAFRNPGPGGRKVQIRKVSQVKDLADSRMVFISAGESGKLDEVVRWARENGALTIGDSEGFAERGVIINFYLSDEKVRFEINTTAAEKGGFQISSLLLKVARIVENR